MAADLTTDRRRRGHPVRWAVVGVSAIVLLPLVVVLGSRLGEDPTPGQRSALLNKAAPEFSLPNIDGGTVSSQELVGRPYLVNFWASWCAPCRQEHEKLEALYARYRPQGMELLGVIWNDTTDGARSYRRDMGGDWPLLRDPDERLALDFGVTGPPETFLV
ncbi:MAG: TlpA family protein disulfide reductase, partial [Acidimicrobiia bacterium]